MTLTERQVTDFQEVIWGCYRVHYRPMPWRENIEPYWIMVSEIMLQQTQVERVKPKFEAFLQHFPDLASLARAPLSEVLTAWVGLGYNRRAKFLQASAKEIMERYNGRLPRSPQELATLPGIGPNTAGAIAAYAFNDPVVFVETNIRTVLLHHFFAEQQEVSEAELATVCAAVLDKSNPREWYWALMDYGAYVKRMLGRGNAQRAKAYKKQSTFDGSLRQVRGRVVALLAEGPKTIAVLEQIISDERLSRAINDLVAEKLIIATENRVQLAE